MPNRNKQKGSVFEREIVKMGEAAGIKSIRAYASDGRSLGESAEVDVLVGSTRIQCKRRKKIAEYIKIPEGADIVVIREDRGDTLAVVPFKKVLKLIKDNKWDSE